MFLSLTLFDFSNCQTLQLCTVGTLLLSDQRNSTLQTFSSWQKFLTAPSAVHYTCGTEQCLSADDSACYSNGKAFHKWIILLTECYHWYDIANILPPPTISLVFLKGTIHSKTFLFSKSKLYLQKTNGGIPQHLLSCNVGVLFLGPKLWSQNNMWLTLSLSPSILLLFKLYSVWPFCTDIPF